MPPTYDVQVPRRKPDPQAELDADTLPYLPDLSPERNALRFAVWERMRAKHVPPRMARQGTERGWQRDAAKDLGVKPETLSRFFRKGSDMGLDTLEALAAVAPAEVALVVGLSDQAQPKRPLWPNLAELVAQLQGNVPPAVIVYAHRLNELWEHDRPAGAWLDDLNRWRKEHGL